MTLKKGVRKIAHKNTTKNRRRIRRKTQNHSKKARKKYEFANQFYNQTISKRIRKNQRKNRKRRKRVKQKYPLMIMRGYFSTPPAPLCLRGEEAGSSRNGCTTSAKVGSQSPQGMRNTCCGTRAAGNYLMRARRADAGITPEEILRRGRTWNKVCTSLCGGWLAHTLFPCRISFPSYLPAGIPF